MLNVVSLFSGIGAFEKGLDNLGIPYNLLAYCEIDKHASKAYSIIHNVLEDKNLKDVTKVDWLDIDERVDLITYGFPCQDISNAGNMKGFTDENGERTRSGLFFEALRIIDEFRPKFAIAENVKALTSKRFANEFKTVLDSLEELGYNNYWQVLNAKDYGIPQNRERVFIISIRKDIDKGFTFPQPIPLKARLKDFLEDRVEEKYYLTTELTRRLVINNEDFDGKALRLVRSDYGKKIRSKYESGELKKPWSEMKQLEPREDDLANTLSTVQKDNYIIENNLKVITVGNVNPSGKGQNGSVIDSDGLARAITIEKGEGQKILVREATKLGYAEAELGDSINLEHPNSKTRRGRVGKEVAQTLTTSCNQAVVVGGVENG